MNERIRELASCNERIQTFFETGPVQRAAIEQFAELIVKETVLEVWIQLFNHGIDLSENTLFLEAMKKTKEHFGVEE